MTCAQAKLDGHLPANRTNRRSHRSMRRDDRGFTLMEVIIVLAVTAALTAVLAPMAFRYVNDAKKTQAQNDANRIAEAIGKFLQDVSLPPYKNNTSSTKSQVKQAGDFDCLYSLLGSDFSTATDATASDSWTSSPPGVQCQGGSVTRDTLENHLLNNTPGGASA